MNPNRLSIELTSRCNKHCWICSRRNAPASIEYGDMDFSLLSSIAKQLSSGMIVQFHVDGEPLLYPEFGSAMDLFKYQVKSVTTNGKLLVEKAHEIIDNIDTLSISVFEKDEEAEEQLDIIREFISIKGSRRPYTNLKLIGDVPRYIYKDLNLLMIHRQIHIEMGSWDYTIKPSVIPEIGICWDFISHPCIHRNGDLSICPRYDPEHLGVIGNLNKEPLWEIWSGPKRLKWFNFHKQGLRSEIPLCSHCTYWGIPTV